MYLSLFAAVFILEISFQSKKQITKIPKNNIKIPPYRDEGPERKSASLIEQILICIFTPVFIIFWKPTAIIFMFYRDFKYETADTKQVIM
jgi:hypothetical protein